MAAVVQPHGEALVKEVFSRLKWKSFIILALQLCKSDQTFSIFPSLHLSYRHDCFDHSLSDSTCNCCTAFLPGPLWHQNLKILMDGFYSVL